VYPADQSRRPWDRHDPEGRGAIAGASLVLLGIAASCAGAMRPPGSCVPEASRYLHEEEIRDLVAARFAEEGIHFTEDYGYEADGIAFEADGFDETLRVGYDYESFEDLEEACRRGDTATWEAEVLDEDERTSLAAGMEEGGDAFLVIESGGSLSTLEERGRVRIQIEEFILWLKEKGRIQGGGRG
jgi:hypothetical protein